MFDTSVLIIDEDLTVCSTLKLLLKRQDYDVDSVSRPKFALKTIERFKPDIILLNVNFEIDISGILDIHPTTILILLVEWENISKAVDGMDHGAKALISKEIDVAKLNKTIQTQLNLRQPYEEMSRMQRMSIEHIIGDSPIFRDILSRLKTISTSGANILIVGETGTGKNVIAEHILQENTTSNKSLITIDSFIEERKEVEALFIKDIDTLELSKQIKFSKKLFQTTQQIKIVSTTTKMLNSLANKGDFRKDLYHQISTVKIEIPPLQARKDDIPLLVNHFLKNLSFLFNRPIWKVDDFACHWLKQQTFQGNIRQLKKLTTRVALSSYKEKITVDDFKFDFENCLKDTPIYMPEVGALTWKQLEILMIKQSLKMNKGDEIAAAKSLSSTIYGLRQQMKEFNISG